MKAISEEVWFLWVYMFIQTCRTVQLKVVHVTLCKLCCNVNVLFKKIPSTTPHIIPHISTLLFSLPGKEASLQSRLTSYVAWDNLLHPSGLIHSAALNIYSVGDLQEIKKKQNSALYKDLQPAVKHTHIKMNTWTGHKSPGMNQ